MCVLTLKISHRPDGIFTYVERAIAGWRCRRQWWLGDLLIVHHHWQLSLECACSRSKVPIAPMGFSHVSCFMLAGWRCVHQQRLGDLLIVHHHWQHSFFCACSSSKVPIAPRKIADELTSTHARTTADPPPRGPMSMSAQEAMSAPGQRPSPASLAQSQLAGRRRPRRHPRRRRRGPHHRGRPRSHPRRRAIQRASSWA